MSYESLYPSSKVYVFVYCKECKKQVGRINTQDLVLNCETICHSCYLNFKKKE